MKVIATLFLLVGVATAFAPSFAKPHRSSSLHMAEDCSASPGLVVITGATSGIGQQSAISLAEKGYHVIVTGRNKERGEAAVEKIKEESKSDKVELVVGDISSLAKIKALASDISTAANGKLDVFVNNAGFTGKEPIYTEDGLEMSFAINVFAPYKLAQYLKPALLEADEPRIVILTGGEAPAAVDIDNLQAEKGYKGLVTYQHAKSITEAMTMMLAKEFEDTKITVNTVFPGRATTSMTKGVDMKSLPGAMKLFYPVFKYVLFRDDGGKSAKKASRSTVFAVSDPGLKGLTGKYYDTNCVEQKIHPTGYGSTVQDAIKKVIDSVKDE